VRQLVEDVQKLTRQAADQEAKQARVANKKPTQKSPPKKTHIRKPSKNGFLGFLNFKFFFNNTNFSL
jgi:hypothetical protein